MRVKRDSLTTGEAAKLCRVAPRTISKWFDNGLIKGYRLPKTGYTDGCRRFDRQSILDFCAERGIPVREDMLPLGSVVQRVLLVSPDDGLARRLPELLPGWEVAAASSAYEAGKALVQTPPAFLVVDAAVGRPEAREILRDAIRPGGPQALAIVGEDEERAADFGSNGSLFRRPFDPALLAARLRDLA